VKSPNYENVQNSQNTPTASDSSKYRRRMVDDQIIRLQIKRIDWLIYLIDNWLSTRYAGRTMTDCRVYVIGLRLNALCGDIFLQINDCRWTNVRLERRLGKCNP